ncbi:MAG: hypothetical protein EON95_13125 [Caulobacteraceae bacterium]|nr:MAG: hypothetical protein EON95_13125 [Caulobacteraceae bacterium]
MRQLPADVVALFVKAGWRPGRRVDLVAPPPIDHPATELLSAFAGLRVGKTGPGVDCATSDIHFGQLFDEPPEAAALALLLGETLIPIAETDNGDGVLYIGESGRCFGASLIHDAVWSAGESFETAIRGLTTGRRVEPILLPGQDCVSLYGETYGIGDPRLYNLVGDRREV